MQDSSRAPDERGRLPLRSELGEAELVRRARLGSVSAFEQLIVTRGPHLYRYLVVRLHNESDARDALQETLTAAWLGLPRLKRSESFWPWLVGIAAHKAADGARRRMGTSEFEIDETRYTDETAVEIRHALASLPVHFRDVLVLRYRLGLSECEVAEVLAIRVGTVKSRSARARKALMDLLK